MSTEQTSTDEPTTSPLERALRLFGDVRGGEGTTVVLMALNVFVVLVAYYVIKTVREPLILTTGGAELKAYASAAQAVILTVAVPVYSYFESRTDTAKLVFGVTIFFILCIEAFFVAYGAEVPMLGFAFFVWVGIFSVAIIAQFWSFANDIYALEVGERLFPLIAVGATVGAPVGAWVAGALFERGLSAGALMQVAAGLLLLHLGLYRVILARPDGKPKPREAAPKEDRSLLGGFALVLRSRYLVLIAVLMMLLNLVNSTGEYLLSSFAEDSAKVALDVALVASPNLNTDAFVSQYIGQFYGQFFFWVNVVGVVLQALVVSRIVKIFGVAGLLFALPIVALANYGWIAAGLGFGAFRFLKTAENATDYSVMNTAKATLWLPTTHDEKFQAKQAIDTFFVRLGDVLAAGLVFLGAGQLAFSEVDFARVNLAVIIAWLFVAGVVLRMYRHRADSPRDDGR
ncbi:MAG: Npt1/Npt2 family nucleotide transporter [Myxococcota bacterium]